MDYSTIKEKDIDPKNSAVFEHLPKQGGTLSIINCDVTIMYFRSYFIITGVKAHINNVTTNI